MEATISSAISCCLVVCILRRLVGMEMGAYPEWENGQSSLRPQEQSILIRAGPMYSGWPARSGQDMWLHHGSPGGLWEARCVGKR